MDTAEIIVTLTGLALAGVVVWYFSSSARQTASAVSSSSGAQEVVITMKDDYSPDAPEVERGKPA
ncbi:MAG: hypothetical protein H7Z21_13100 [Hymenobacter sp.]|nr:hypothetical protein [Hymenobacter sp.]